jgi:drug/metabolite transporter (DMT)-like permease
MRAAVLAVAAAALLWSSGGLFIKLAPMPALAVACGRSLIAGVFYLLLLRPNLRAARWTTAAAYAGCIVSFVTATKLTTAANAIFLQYTAPAYVLLLSPFVLRERLRAIDLWSVLLSLLGLSLFFLDKVEAGQTLGNVLGIVSGVFFAFNIVLLRRDQGDALSSMTLGNLIAAAVTLPFALRSLPAVATPLGAGVLLYLGIVQLGLAYWLFARGVRRVPQQRRRSSACWSPSAIRSGCGWGPASGQARGRSWAARWCWPRSCCGQVSGRRPPAYRRRRRTRRTTSPGASQSASPSQSQSQSWSQSQSRSQSRSWSRSQSKPCPQRSNS